MTADIKKYSAAELGKIQEEFKRRYKPQWPLIAGLAARHACFFTAVVILVCLHYLIPVEVGQLRHDVKQDFPGIRVALQLFYEQMIQLFVQLPDFQFSLQVDPAVICLPAARAVK